MPRCRRPFGLALLFVAACASAAWAHGFGQRYDLPLPLSFYVWGGGATVALSFVVMALFLRREHDPDRFRIDWNCRNGFVDALLPSVRALAVVILILVIVAGLFGNQDPVRNIAPVMIWIIGWVGLAFICALIGNVWELLNPWSTVFASAERLYRRVRPGAVLGLARPYPEKLGGWPAFLLFVVFAWMELIWSGKSVPADLAAALLIYSVLTWLGMFIFGRDAWLRHGEFLTCVFGIFARFAPILRMADGQCALRPPALGLLEPRPLPISMVALVVALLATVTFDGFLETPLWARVDLAVLNAAPDSAWATALDLREDQAVRLVRTFALIACLALFVGAYAGFCWLIAAVAGARDVTANLVVRRFVLTLVPIALAYHIAHYFSFLFIGGQYAIPRLSDPFGWGWNLFGTAHYQIDIGVVTPWLQWTVAVVAVVLGHVIAVYLSHVTALRLFRDRAAALKSQIPMLALMVGYTMISLWILSQPIVETGAG
jgi:hypothetical protein